MPIREEDPAYFFLIPTLIYVRTDASRRIALLLPYLGTQAAAKGSR